MEKFKLYVRESYDELMHKVTWPSWTQLQSNTVAVLVASAILALIIMLMDMVFNFVMETLYQL
ncbi:MAG TPA: preprotein translocase subunit SecE [Phaeodactylibacter sp.]|nr:preprotein translocase subunit SecE [Phaeodactylibacter sp.]